MKTLTQAKLNNILDLHKKWLNNEEGGRRANLAGDYLHWADLMEANLKKADLRDASLRWVNLHAADLSGANLHETDLSWAYLTETNFTGSDLSKACLRGTHLTKALLRGANLTGADLTDADLSGADLTGADLSGADLTGANLREANLTNAKLPDFQIPQGEDLIVWKKIEKCTLVKLKIPKEAKRTGCLISDKCRAEYAEVLEIIGEGRRSMHDETFIYEVGNVVKPDSYGDDIRNPCQPGIHFFMKKEEAEVY